MNTELPLVSIVGRPNVGKSTLFNRVMGRRVSIVDDMPGVTRDRIFGRCKLEGRAVYLVDTGGLSYSNPGTSPGQVIDTEVEKQIMMSIEGSAVLIFMTDCQAGVLPEDRFVADVLRRSGKPIIVAANKADGGRFDDGAFEFHALGFGEPVPVSAQHGRNIDILVKRLTEHLPEAGALFSDEKPVRFCVTGRPNVGKSSITNAILGEERCVVSPVPGTTRDRVDTEFVFEDRNFVIVDTAGIRRRKTKMDNLEYYSFGRAKTAIEESDISVLVLDAQDGLLEGDKRIASYVQEHMRGFIIAVNKMDLVENPDYDIFIDNTLRTAPFLRNIPFLFVSALEAEGMDSLINRIVDVHQRMNELLPLDLLRNIVYDTRMLYSPRSKGRKVGEIKGLIHDRVNPPRIIIKVNDPDLFAPDYRKLIENRIRMVFNLTGVPLDMIYAGDKKTEEQKKAAKKKKKKPVAAKKKKKPGDKYAGKPSKYSRPAKKKSKKVQKKKK